MTDPLPLDYEPPRPSRVPWAAVVSCAIGALDCFWSIGGWAYYAAQRSGGPQAEYAARVLLGFLVSATTPGAMVGLFLGLVAVQRARRSRLGWAGLTLNAIALVAGAGGFFAAFVFSR